MDDQQKDVHASAPLLLVVENESISRMSLSELLRDQGYQVVEAADSGSAINHIIRNTDLKVILSNLEMPSWKNVIAHARTTVPKAYILGMVRYGALPNALEAQRLGASGYMIKPLSFDQVNQWIEHFLTGQSRIKP